MGWGEEMWAYPLSYLLGVPQGGNVVPQKGRDGGCNSGGLSGSGHYNQTRRSWRRAEHK